MGELVELFAQRHADPETDDEWESGLPLTFTEIAAFLQLAEDLVKADSDPDRFAILMDEVREVVNGWPHG